MAPRRLIVRRRPPQQPPAISKSPLARIVEETNAAAKELGKLKELCDTARATNLALINEKISIENQITNLRAELDAIRTHIDHASQAHLSLDVDHATKKASYENHARHLELRIATLKQEIATLEPLQREVSELKRIKESLTQELNYLEKNIAFIREEHETENQSMETKRDQIREEISKLESLIAKNGAIVTAIEHDRAKLEIYIRRLQRYYDETGVNLKILHEFDLAPYGQPQT